MNPALLFLGGIAAVSAVGIILSRHALYSALCLVATICALAVIFLILNAQFLFAVQIIVYAGAIMVLFVFIIALLNPEIEERPPFDWHAIVGIGASIIVSIFMWNLAGSSAVMVDGSPKGALYGQLINPSALQYSVHSVNSAGNVQTVAGQVFTTYLLPFEVTSLLLLVAAVGSVYLTNRSRKEQ